MVFKRRDPRPWWKAVGNFLWPRGGWARAFEYVKLRVRRLPDTPEKISRGIWAGVFTAFTPFYGLHFIFSVLLAKVMRGNIPAALLATFVGNPLTYVPIGVIALQTGHWLLGTSGARATNVEIVDGQICRIGCQFSNAFGDLWHNLLAPITGRDAEWDGLAAFYAELFYPYLIGGLIPGVVFASLAYYLSVPVIAAYQNRRRKQLRAKLEQLNQSSTPKDGTGADLS